MTDTPDLPPLPDWAEALMQKVAAPVEAEPEVCLYELSDTTDVPTPTMTPVKSSNIQSIGHDGTSLWVKFMNNTLYRYPTAGTEHHAAMLAAESAGRYFQQHIKLAHRGEKI